MACDRNEIGVRKSKVSVGKMLSLGGIGGVVRWRRERRQSGSSASVAEMRPAMPARLLLRPVSQYHLSPVTSPRASVRNLLSVSI